MCCGPCLGCRLLPIEDATPDSACSMRDAATDSALTEPIFGHQPIVITEIVHEKM